MNRWQVARQISHVLAGAKWPGGTENVFGRVVVSAAEERDVDWKGRYPMAWISPRGGNGDDEEPDLITVRYVVRFVVRVAGDDVGEAAIIGSHRASLITSDGRGLLELEEVIYDAAARITRINGASIKVVAASMADAQFEKGRGWAGRQEYMLEAVTTADRSYAAPTRLAGTSPGGGAASLTWLNPPDRYDLYRVRLFRAVGATPPAYLGGTEVALGSDLPVAFVDTPGAGTYSYSLFATYDEDSTYDRGTPVNDQQVSPAETLAGLVVT